jgi:hypothetical protein
VAGGGTLSSTAMALNCQFAIQGHTFSTDFRILDLQGSDIILGVNLFTQHNPVTFDFIGRKLTLGIDGTEHSFNDHLLHKDKIFISSDQCSKLIEQGATGYMLYHVTTEDDNSEPSPKEPVLDEVSAILHQFQDVFQSPTGLPPARSCDHQIPLLPDAKPPNIRPYRMSHSQKNIIEQLVKEML